MRERIARMPAAQAGVLTILFVIFVAPAVVACWLASIGIAAHAWHWMLRAMAQ